MASPWPAGALAEGQTGIARVTGRACEWTAYELVSGDVTGGKVSNCSTQGLMNQRFWDAAGIHGADQAAAEALARMAASDSDGSATAALGRAAVESGAAGTEIAASQATGGVELSCGYWLLVSDTAQPMLLPVGPEGAEAAVKSTVPTVDKQVSEDGSGWAKAVDAGAGETVSYRIACTMPSNAAAYGRLSYKMVDELPAGVSTRRADVTVSASWPDGTEEDITSKCGIALVGGTLAVDVGNGDAATALGKDAAEATVTVSYTGRVGEDAATGSEKGNPDTAHVEYTGSPTTESTASSEESTAQVLCWRIAVHKTGSGRGLAGAVLALRDGDGKTIATLTTGADGEAAFPQVDAGSYTISEVSAPSGYAAVGKTEVEIAADIEGDASGAGLSATASGAGKVAGADAGTGTVEVEIADPALQRQAGTGARRHGGTYAKTGATVAGALAAAAALAAAGSALARRGRRGRESAPDDGGDNSR